MQGLGDTLWKTNWVVQTYAAARLFEGVPRNAPLGLKLADGHQGYCMHDLLTACAVYQCVWQWVELSILDTSERHGWLVRPVCALGWPIAIGSCCCVQYCCVQYAQARTSERVLFSHWITTVVEKDSWFMGSISVPYCENKGNALVPVIFIPRPCLSRRQTSLLRSPHLRLKSSLNFVLKSKLTCLAHMISPNLYKHSGLETGGLIE